MDSNDTFLTFEEFNEEEQISEKLDSSLLQRMEDNGWNLQPHDDPRKTYKKEFDLTKIYGHYQREPEKYRGGVTVVIGKKKGKDGTVVASLGTGSNLLWAVDDGDQLERLIDRPDEFLQDVEGSMDKVEVYKKYFKGS